MLACGINPLSHAPMRLPASPGRRLYVCGGGRYIATASAEKRTGETLCNALRLPHLLDAPHKPDQAEEAAGALATAFLARPAMAWVDLLAPAGAAVTIVNNGSEAVSD